MCSRVGCTERVSSRCGSSAKNHGVPVVTTLASTTIACTQSSHNRNESQVAVHCSILHRKRMLARGSRPKAPPGNAGPSWGHVGAISGHFIQLIKFQSSDKKQASTEMYVRSTLPGAKLSAHDASFCHGHPGIGHPNITWYFMEA